MKQILITVIVLYLAFPGFAQTGYTVNDSTSIGDTAKLLLKDTAGIQKKPDKKARRISPTGDLRAIDGLFLGLGFRIQGQKSIDSAYQKVTAIKGLRTKALIFEYRAEWLSVLKNTDITLGGLADIKGNILNFFGRGNNTLFDQSGDFRVFYRVNFSFYQLEPAFRVRLPGNSSISFGPALQHFVFNPGDNPGRYINSPAIINQYEHLQETKTHGGLILNLNRDTRDNLRSPTKGHYFNLRVHGYRGLNNKSSDYTQAFPQFSFYKSLDKTGNIVLANRIGAGFTLGKTAFYQSAFLGSQENLLGYRKFRFAGDNLLYNNLEARITFPRFLRSILRGKTGIIGFYDVGRVWIKEEESDAIHHGYGAAIFLTPFNRFFVRVDAGFSKEGLQPTVALRQRF
ncbi:MAG: BamA/TamA family outer membrane protein [Sphingobacteriaceae bacterium]|nr:BamA/TamA family outer membrane protein [Sphingobacteriaceae bacterium]